jgi:NADPH2:quinone reductase
VLLEARSRAALARLARAAAPMAEVVGDGRVIGVTLEQVVPGDVLILREGHVIAADVIQPANLSIMEARPALTGDPRRCNLGGRDRLSRDLAGNIPQPGVPSPLASLDRTARFSIALPAWYLQVGFLADLLVTPQNLNRRPRRKGPVRHTRIVVTHYGGPDELLVIEEECPEPKNGEARVRVLAAGVSLPDLMMREGIHPETPPLPFTPGWDLVGGVDRLGDGVSGIESGQVVAALPISGAYAEFVCLPQRELVPVPSGLDPADAVSLILNYVTAYQMLHHSARVSPGQDVLIHGAAGGVGTALLQLGRLAGLTMYGTCSSRGASAVSDLGGVPIDYQHQDFVKEIHRLTSDGVDVVFDSMGGTHIWRSREALRPGGRVVAYGLTASLRGGRLASGRSGGRHRFRGIAIFGLYIAGGWLLPGRKRVVPYSIQWLKRRNPALFRHDLITLFDLLRQQKIKPLVAERLPLREARHAHELLGMGGVIGKIVLVRNRSSPESEDASQRHAADGAVDAATE